MSVDYDANYGIGYEVCEKEEISENEELENGLNEYILTNCGDDFECFYVGDSYTNINMSTFLTVKDPFKNGLNLEAVKLKLDNEVERLKLETEGDFGCVGGLYVW